MKKISLLGVLSVMLFILSSCGNADDTVTSNIPSSETPNVAGNTATPVPSNTPIASNPPVASNKTEVKFTVFSEDPFISSVIEYYNHVTEDVNIAYDFFDKQGTASQQDYSMFINTALMAGNAPDIFDVYNLPYQKYIKKEQLYDMTGGVSKLFEEDDYFENIINAYQFNGKNYMVPICFSAPILYSNDQILEDLGISIDDSIWDWDKFEEVCRDIMSKSSGDQYSALPKIDKTELFYYLFSGSDVFMDIQESKATFTSPEALSIFRFIEEFDNKEYISDLDAQTIQQVRERFGDGKYAFMFFPMTSMTHYMLLKSTWQENGSMRTLPSDGTGKTGLFSTWRLYTINANSQYTSESWDFLSYLLSSRTQSLLNLGQFPVNKTSLNFYAHRYEEMDTEIITQMLASMNVTNPQPVKFSYYNDLPILEEYFSTLNYAPYSDYMITEIVYSALESLINGSISYEECAEQIQERVSIYLNE